MEFPSGGMASAASEDFCFFVDAEGKLSSGFLFFSIAAWACSSRKLRGAASVEVVPGSCALGLSLVGGGYYRGGRVAGCSSFDVHERVGADACFVGRWTQPECNPGVCQTRVRCCARVVECWCRFGVCLECGQWVKCWLE